MAIPLRSWISTTGFALALATSTASHASPANLTVEIALTMIDGCRAQANTKGQSHAIVVVDAGGHVIASLRMDGNAPGIMAFAEQKARAAAMWGFGTLKMAEAVRETPGLGAAQYIVTVAGGEPVRTSDGKILLGGIGVSGEAPADDLSCAKAGIAAAGPVLAQLE